jgi:DNA topoisomerase IA
MGGLSVELTMAWIIVIIVASIVGLMGAGALIAWRVMKAVNKQRDVNWLTFCEKAAQSRIATLESQNRLDASVIADQGREIIDLRVKIKAMDHMGKQIQLVASPDVDASGRVK